MAVATAVLLNGDDLTIDDVKRLHVNEGDTIVLRFTGYLTEAQADEIQRRMRTMFPNNKTLVLDRGTDISVIDERGTPAW